MVRRVAVLMAALLALCGSALASGIYVVQLDGAAALVDAEGNVLLDGAARMFEVRAGALYAAGGEGAYRLYDASGAALSEDAFEMIADAGDALIFRRDGLYGAMDSEGTVVLAPEWTQLVSCGDGAYFALAGDPLDERPDEILRIAPDGEATGTGVRTSGVLRPFREGRMVFTAEDGSSGCLNANGDVVIAPEWRYIGDFAGGVALAAGDDGCGLIDAHGGVRIRAEYAWMARSDALVAGLTAEGALEVYDAGAALRFALESPVAQAEVVGGCVAVASDGCMRLYDADGACLCEASSDALFSEGVDGQIIASDGRWGEACQWLIEPDGTASEARFQRILPLFSGRYAFIEMPGVEYYSRDLDSIQTSWDYARARYGLMDDRGAALLPAQALEIRALGGDRLLIVDGDSAVFADADGAPIRVWPTGEGGTASFEAGA